jgi:hypothetical protein
MLLAILAFPGRTDTLALDGERIVVEVEFRNGNDLLMRRRQTLTCGR